MACIHQGDRYLYLLCIGTEVKLDSRISPGFYREAASSMNIPPPLSEEVPFIRVGGGEAAFIMAILWLGDLFAGLLETL